MKGFGGANIGQLMQQAQKMQEKMAQAQEELANEVVTATSGGGMVEVQMTGKKQLVKISLKKEVVDPDDVEMLEDLILVAINEASKKADELSEDKMGSAGLPSGLPF
ncbi:MAG: YbaB/EbfC family nucleoid-associated protein [Clostridia bacterium]|nr:YbaB/EbfC family nucleoid-associated protein [Clostridia bacterium]